jgi:hypothetical protein
MKRITFKPIDTTRTNVHGLVASHGNRLAEVVRVYEGQWYPFLFIDLHPVRVQNFEHMTRSKALKVAKAFLLSTEILPVWKTVHEPVPIERRSTC